MSRELAIIDRIAQLTGQGRAMADDAFWEPDTRLIYTTDMLVENRHFDLSYFSARDLGWKAAAVNISDIAGMGGRLKHLLISLALPENLGMDWIAEFYEGLLEACQSFNGAIIGGDTVSAQLLTLNVTAIGECPLSHHPGHRYQARAGDYIIASGFHGLSHIGLLALQQKLSGYEISKAAHLRPFPRIEAGLALSSRFERYSLMDSSDGLADALLKIASASQQTLTIDQNCVPVHPEVVDFWQNQTSLGSDELTSRVWETILYGGEDFELVATVPTFPPELASYFQVIGRVEEDLHSFATPGAWLMDSQTSQKKALSMDRTYQHFAFKPMTQNGINA